MNQKTTTIKHTPFFDVVDKNSLCLDDYQIDIINVGISTTNILFMCTEVVYLEAKSGIISLLATLSLDITQVNYFMLHGLVAIKKDVYFNCLAVSSDCQYVLYTPKNKKTIAHYIESTISAHQFKEQFFIPSIYAFYRQEKNGPYYYANEKHDYCEMTLVDFGQLSTVVDGVVYELEENQVLFYGPSQIHNQQIEAGQSCRYVSVMFEMNPIYSDLLNRKFTLTQSQTRLMEEILKYSNKTNLFYEEMIISKFKEFIMHCLVDDAESSRRLTSMRVNYENNLINEMISYIHDNIYRPLRVTDLCKQFAVSRTVVQDLFNKYLSTTAKTYINQAKLNQSKILINESKYAISEISAILNYSSVHYFSRVFKHEFKISPTEYAKSVLK